MTGRNTAHRGRRSDFTFAQVPSVGMNRSSFDRSHGVKTALNGAYLYPIFADEALPGDTFSLNLSAIIRMATPLKPVMDNIYADFFFFAVPNRLVWDNWRKFCGEQVDPGDSISFTVPQFSGVTVAEESLSDYLGLPLGTSMDFNSLHHRAYNLVYNEWFRDEDLVDSVVVDTDNGPDTLGDYVLLKRGKRHDYFTGCKPWTQKGTAVDLPLGTSAPVSGTIAGAGDPTFDHSDASNSRLKSLSATKNVQTENAGSGDDWLTWNTPNLSLTSATADLSSATAATINEIREAFQIQKLLERDARAGTRYAEIVRSHFGVVHPDASWRPEYLGGGSAKININPVVATMHFTGASELGDLAAFAVAQANGIGFVKSFTEHCVVIGLLNVRADLTYQQGMPRMFSRQTRYDFYWPSLAFLGEQAVLNKELYADGTAADENTFGYQERYAEYKYKPSHVTGVFRSDHSTPLDSYHLALDFSSLPTLNQTFIEEEPPFSRVNAASTDAQFFADIWYDFKCARPMPTFSVPGLIDHF